MDINHYTDLEFRNNILRTDTFEIYSLIINIKTRVLKESLMLKTNEGVYTWNPACVCVCICVFPL